MILFTDETIGLMPIGFLCIFFRKYSWAVLWLLGGLQKVVICHGINPDLFLFSKNFFLSFFVRLVVSEFSFL